MKQGKFSLDDAKRISAWYGQYGNRNRNSERRARRRSTRSAADAVRIAVALTDIPANTTGLVRIWDGTQDAAIPTDEVVLALYKWGAKFDIEEGEQVFIAPFEKQWRIVPPERDEESNGVDYVCCRCEMSKLFACVENPDLTVEKVKNPPSLVTGTTIEHQLKITLMLGDEEMSRVVQLDALDCTAIDCKTKDMTGEYVGDSEIGIIYYGNSPTCLPTKNPDIPCSNPLPHNFEQELVTLSVAAGDGVAPPVRDGTFTPIIRPASEDHELTAEIIFSIGTAGSKFFAIFNILDVSNNFVFQIRAHKGISGIVDGFYLGGSLGGVFIADFDTNSHSVHAIQNDGIVRLFFDGTQISELAYDFGCLNSITASAELYNDFPGANGISYQAMSASTLDVTSIKAGFN